MLHRAGARSRAERLRRVQDRARGPMDVPDECGYEDERGSWIADGGTRRDEQGRRVRNPDGPEGHWVGEEFVATPTALAPDVQQRRAAAEKHSRVKVDATERRRRAREARGDIFGRLGTMRKEAENAWAEVPAYEAEASIGARAIQGDEPGPPH